jgi:hypothetical protein
MRRRLFIWLPDPQSERYRRVLMAATDAVLRAGDIPVLTPSGVEDIGARSIVVQSLLSNCDVFLGIDDGLTTPKMDSQRQSDRHGRNLSDGVGKDPPWALISSLGLRTLSINSGVDVEGDVWEQASHREDFRVQIFRALIDLRVPGRLDPDPEVQVSWHPSTVRTQPYSVVGYRRCGPALSPDFFRLYSPGTWSAPPNFTVGADTCTDAFWTANVSGRNESVSFRATLEHTAAFRATGCAHPPFEHGPAGQFAFLSGYACQRPTFSSNLSDICIAWQRWIRDDHPS